MKRNEGALPATLHVRARSNGEPSARAYVVATAPAPTVVREEEASERVVITDPRHTPTLTPVDPARRSGPRDPEQKRWRDPKAPEVAKEDAAPDPRGRPIGLRSMEIDPEMVLDVLREVTARERAAREATAAVDAEDPRGRHG